MQIDSQREKEMRERKERKSFHQYRFFKYKNADKAILTASENNSRLAFIALIIIKIKERLLLF